MPNLATTTDPLIQLAFAVALQAVKDLHDDDPLVSLDALEWFLFDAPIWFDALGLSGDEDVIFRKVINERPQTRRYRGRIGPDRDKTHAALPGARV